jgi:hypothetical protein
VPAIGDMELVGGVPDSGGGDREVNTPAGEGLASPVDCCGRGWASDDAGCRARSPRGGLGHRSATSASLATDAMPDLSAHGSTFISLGLTNGGPSGKPECR